MGAALRCRCSTRWCRRCRRARRRSPSSVRRLGLRLHPDGHERRGVDAGDRGRITELSPSLLALTPVLDHITVVSNLELRNALHDRQSRLVNQLRVPQLLARQADRRQRLRAGHDGRSDRRARDRPRHADPVARDRHRSHRAGRQLRQRLRVRLSEQPVVVVADDAAADRGRSARRVRAAVRRRRQPGAAARRAEEERQHPRLDDRRHGAAARELGAGDRVRVGQYLDSVREVERPHPARRAERRAALPDLDRPASVPAVWEDHVKLMFDLQVLALQADVTRVITFQLARETSTRTYPHIGVPEPHHPVSHPHQRSGEAGQAREDQRASRVAVRLSDREAAGDAGRRRLAARSHALSARQRHGQSRRPRPHEPADRRRGRARRRFKGGRHIRFEKPTPLANLHLTLLDKVGVHLDTFRRQHGTRVGSRAAERM